MKLSSTLNLLLAGAALLASTPGADAAERKLRGRGRRHLQSAVSNDDNADGGASSDRFPIIADGHESQQRRKLGILAPQFKKVRNAKCHLPEGVTYFEDAWMDSRSMVSFDDCQNACIDMGSECYGFSSSHDAPEQSCEGPCLRSAWTCEIWTVSGAQPRLRSTPDSDWDCYIRNDVGNEPNKNDEEALAWEPGTLCGAGTTCNNCKDGYYEYWDSLAFTACGREPCWEDGAYCAAGTTCNECCNSYHYNTRWAWTLCGESY